MNLKPYPEYKDSGVPWLGDVPKHWEMRKFRTILTPIAERNRPDLPLLSVVREKGVIERNIKDDSENYNYIPDDLSNYKVVKSGQFAMNKMKAWQGSYGISKFNGIVSPAYFVFDLKCIEPDFFHKAVRSRAYVPFFTQASDGVRVGQWDLSQTRMKEIPFFIPSPEEQLAIARFLDYKTTQIARFIKAKKRMIELMKEQKQVIINDAVTGKIVIKDEGGRLKAEKRPDPSFIPHPSSFLQTVPDGWEVRRLKNVVKTNQEALSEKTSPSYEFNYLDISSVKTGYLISKPQKLLFENAPSRARRIVKKGDTIVSTVRTYLRSVFHIENECDDLIVSTGFAVLTPDEIIDQRYIGYLLRSDIFIDSVIRNSIGVSYPAISETKLGSLKILLPSSFIEQQQIVSYIETKTAALDLTISRTEREIALMQEYRTRLISDVVTGKVDVRDIKIPDIAGIDATIDESIDEPEGEEEMEPAEAEE